MSQDAVKATKPIVGGQVSVGVGIRRESSTTASYNALTRGVESPSSRFRSVRRLATDPLSAGKLKQLDKGLKIATLFSQIIERRATLEMVNGASNEKETAKNAQQSKREWYKQELTGCRTITSASWGRPRMVRARTRPVLIYNSIKAEDVLFLKRSMRSV
ncbi:hypothetical protein BGAL_0081g00180 [Botrytis galanthina]|uniref:Uncharacterized protein n=1 Tax=Botrytis galanthina TaxID=278940 RepID=A0A4S8R3C2_9HELO|nr:hypothetical protein BGAL_0081g00180 [Botrytis galanthina]